MAKHLPRMTEAEIQSEVRRAFRQAPAADEPRAIAVRYEPANRSVYVWLEGAGAVGVPVALLPALADASDAVLATAELSPDRTGVRWDLVDEDYEVSALITAALGPFGHLVIRHMGRVGGRSTSPAKRRASRANGAKGGRPKTRKAS